MNYWDKLGKVLAKVARVAAKGALWTSQHPEVVGIIAQVAGSPQVAAIVKGVKES